MIIDTHVHFYDTERPGGVPWPEPENEVLYRPSMPSRFKALAEPSGITGVVVVEASTWVEDNQWILDLAADEALVKGFVGNLDPEEEKFEDLLNRFAANPIFRGIRVRTGRVVPYGSARLRDCLSMMVEKGLSLDLLVGAAMLDDLAAIARDHPSLKIIINHTAGIAVDGSTPDAAWISGMEGLSDFENVYCKLSGMVEKAGSEAAPADVEFYRPTIDVLVKTIGVDRLLYSSNWTPCERVGPYDATLNIVRDYFAAFWGDVLEKILWRNSKAAYRWISRE